MRKVLVTGGGGYIGSHMVKMLAARGVETVTLDTFENGHRDAVLAGEVITGNIGDAKLLEEIFERHAPEAVIHFAAYTQVAESVRQPEKYKENNVARSAALVDVAAQHNVPFIFSSTAAVYGNPDYSPIDEDHPLKPINPYGESKLQCERLLQKTHERYGMPCGMLRYFNAAGADPEGRLGERHEPETHLIPLVLQAIAGKRDTLSVFGRDYDTPDGTCVRDYVHVWDLCEAHILLLERLLERGGAEVYNVGTGRGYSILEVLDAAEKVTGRKAPYVFAPRREGDPATLVADGARIRRELGWKPVRSELETIIADAWTFMTRRNA